MDYIENTLGIKVHYQPWNHTDELPYYLLDRYDYRQATLDSVRTLFLYPKTELDQLASVKKQIVKIQKFEPLPVVIILKNISRSRLQYMLSARIPFIVPEKQIYLPFMGVALQNKFGAENVRIEQLQPSAQVLFFYYLYQKKKQIYMSDVSKKLGFSAMTVSRAIRQLEQTTFFTTEKDGVQKKLTGKYTARELYDKMQPYLSSPVRKTIYVDKQTPLSPMRIAGMSALSQMSMISPPDIPCYAVNGKKERTTGTDILIDASAQIKIELWKYDPDILSGNDAVDPLSLAMSLKDNPDERIEEAVEILINKILEVS
nr:hypothetical protein [uncultured Schaedlerella sp.]